jgi:hypothetical protein
MVVINMDDPSVWIQVSQLVLMCYAHGYGKFGNYRTLEYIVLCHYKRKWLLATSSKV